MVLVDQIAAGLSSSFSFFSTAAAITTQQLPTAATHAAVQLTLAAADQDRSDLIC